MSDRFAQLTLLKLQSVVPKTSLDNLCTLLRDRVGQSENISERITVYNNGLDFVRVVEPIDQPERPTTLMTLTEYKNTNSQMIKNQQVVISSVQGDPHAFLASIGQKPSHTWIEKGLLFQSGSIHYRITSIFDHSNKEIDPANAAVVIEALFPQKDSVDHWCQKLMEAKMAFLKDIVPYEPEVRHT